MVRNAAKVSKRDLEFFKHIRQIRVWCVLLHSSFFFFLKHPGDNAAISTTKHQSLFYTEVCETKKLVAHLFRG